VSRQEAPGPERFLASLLLALEREQTPYLNLQDLSERLQSGDRRGVHATFHEADELDGAAYRLGKLLLCELPCPTEACNALAELLLKHTV
jgi:hypothetical protein